MGAPTDTVVGTMAEDIQSVLPQRVWRRGWPSARQRPQRRSRTTHRPTTHHTILDAQESTITRLATVAIGMLGSKRALPALLSLRYNRVKPVISGLDEIRIPACRIAPISRSLLLPYRLADCFPRLARS
jgi:hypothetical protein